MSYTKTIDTNRLILRPFRLNDAKDMFMSYCNDEEVCKYLTWNPHLDIKVTEDLLKSWVDSYNKENTAKWAITIKENGDHVVGSIDVCNVFYENNTLCAEIGYCLAKKYWSHGYMSEALKYVINYLFNNTPYEKLVIAFDINNKASKKVALKNNFKLSNKLIEREVPLKNKVVTIQISSITKIEYLLG